MENKIKRILGHIYTDDMIQTKATYEEIIRLIEDEKFEADSLFNFISALTALYKLGVEDGKREERAKRNTYCKYKKELKESREY